MDKESIGKLIEIGGGVVKVTEHKATGESFPLQVLPPGYQLAIPSVDQAEKWLDAPLRKRGTFSFGHMESFSRYFNEHKIQASRIFAKITQSGASFEGRLNFHDTAPAWGDHICSFALLQTPEWQTFMGNNRKDMTQEDFATFLEENADMFVEPSGATLLELVSTLEGAAHCYVESGIKLQTGAIKLKLTEEVTLRSGAGVTAGTKEGEMEIPSVLKLGIAPFEGTSRYEINARLKYTIKSRKLLLRYEAVQPHLVVRQVANDVLQFIAKQTGVEPFHL